MSASTAALNAAVTAMTGLVSYAGLSNSGGPSNTGANELSGGSYARQPVAFAAVSGGAQATSNSQTWPVAASTSGIGWATFWTAITAGTYHFDVVLTTTVSFGSAGSLVAATGAMTITGTMSL